MRMVLFASPISPNNTDDLSRVNFERDIFDWPQFFLDQILRIEGGTDVSVRK
jgi:hypothetical protein